MQMKITNATKEAIVPFVLGNDNVLWKSRSGRELVKLFQSYGFRNDVYNEQQGGLPKLNNSVSNTSKSNYVKDRLLKISESDLKKLVEQLVEESKDKCESIRQINEHFLLDGIQLSYNGDVIVWEGMTNKPSTKNEVVFKENERKVIDCISDAKVSLLIAMAWFTNENIKEALARKLKEGLRIELVIYKNGINAAHGVDLEGFDYIEIRGSRGGIMHDKFCVIDNQNVLTGSYNWTVNAECKNDENVLITADNEMATKYSIEFRRMKPLV